MKSYTDIKQSKKLAKILPLESADMCYGIDDDTLQFDELPWLTPYHTYTYKEHYIPCWSLSALLNVLPYPSLHKTFSGWRCDSYNKEGTSYIMGNPFDDPIDTCYDMILILYEIEML